MDTSNNFKSLGPILKGSYGKMPKPKGIVVSVSGGQKQQEVGSLTPSQNPGVPSDTIIHISHQPASGEPGVRSFQSVAGKTPNENFISNNPYRETNIQRIDKFPRIFKISKI